MQKRKLFARAGLCLFCTAALLLSACAATPAAPTLTAAVTPTPEPAPTPLQSPSPAPEPASTPLPTPESAPESTPEPPPEPVEPVPFTNFLFLGDSLFSNPHWVSDLWYRNGHQVFAGGGAGIPQFFGVTTQYVTVGTVGPMTGSMLGRDFNGIVILLGANDLAIREAEQIEADYRRLLEELRGATDVPIFVLKIFPVNHSYDAHHWEDADACMARTNLVNAEMEEWIATVDGMYFVDATSEFTGADGYLIGDSGDGLHIHPERYEDFYRAIESAICSTGAVCLPEKQG